MNQSGVLVGLEKIANQLEGVKNPELHRKMLDVVRAMPSDQLTRQETFRLRSLEGEIERRVRVCEARGAG